MRTSSEKTAGLEAADADVTLLRLGLEGTWRGIEVGMRHDGGDAETGFGLDLGGGLAWSDPASGIAAEVSARGLLTHEAGVRKGEDDDRLHVEGAYRRHSTRPVLLPDFRAN